MAPRAAKTLVPVCWRGEIKEVLISEARIQKRVAQLARRLQADYADRELVIIALLNGTIMFLADLVRNLKMPVHLDFIGISSYGGGTTAGRLSFTKELKIDVRGRDILLIDDILDTGRTLKTVISKLEQFGPRSLQTCVLLNKKERRVENVTADYIGFEIPDLFVVGYGLDFAEQYRNLPFVGVLKDSIYQPQ
jgi:hypoxanthine phosphoribosyltransferase